MRRIQLVKSEEMLFEELEKVYIRKCKVKNLSEFTIDFYKGSCHNFRKQFQSELMYAHQVNGELLDDYILQLRARGVSDTTIQTYLRGIRPIINLGIELGYIQKFKIVMPKVVQELKDIYSDLELTKLIERPGMRSFSEFRNYVIINFLLATGVRSNELLNIKLEDIDFEQGMIILRVTKNGKQRIVPISKSLKILLYEYIDYRESNDISHYLFCSEFGNKLHRGSLVHAITKYCRKRGVQKHSIHLFRHTFATKWILNGGDPFQLQRILGHSTMKMVNRYINMTGEDLKIRFNECNPLEQLQINKKEHIGMKNKRKG